MFFAFAALSTGPETDLKVMATALGAGILLDATVVRALLVPALIAVLGKGNWWLPHGHPGCCGSRQRRQKARQASLPVLRSRTGLPDHLA